MIHGNDLTAMSYCCRGDRGAVVTEEMWTDLISPQGQPCHIPAEKGDSIYFDGRRVAVVTAEDVGRGYLEHGEPWLGFSSGQWLSRVIFIVPRSSTRPGDAGTPSSSEFVRQPAGKAGGR